MPATTRVRLRNAIPTGGMNLIAGVLALLAFVCIFGAKFMLVYGLFERS